MIDTVLSKKDLWHVKMQDLETTNVDHDENDDDDWQKRQSTTNFYLNVHK